MGADPRPRGSSRWSRRVICQAAAACVGLYAGVPNAAAQTATVRGFVRDSLGAGVAGAEVLVNGSTLRAVSDAKGAFRIIGLAPGRVELSVRRLGFQPTMVVGSAVPADWVVEVRLIPIPQSMPVVNIRERAEPFEGRLAGFNARMAKKVGHFITREQIESRQTTTFTDLLRSVPGVRITPIGSIRDAVRIRGARCAPLVFIDGFPATAGEFDLDMIDPVSVEGIEIYSGMTTVPGEFVGPRGLERCGVVAVWSRPARGYARSPDRRDDRHVDIGALVAQAKVFTADQVDSPAALDAELTASFPDSLWNAGVSGRVVAEFVVDTAGLVEPGTIGIVSSSHALFSRAVREGLVKAQFRPAVLHGRPVRQVVQLPVAFSAGGEKMRPPPDESIRRR